jgi:hypothetical protein
MKLKLVLTSVVLLSHFPVAAEACTVCMGGDDSKIGPAMNAAIFLLLGCIGGVLGLLVAFGITLMRRANAPLPPEAELQQS